MKNVIIALMLVAPAFASASVKSEIAQVEKATQACLDNPDNYSTYGMNTCLSEGTEAADRILNRIYKTAVVELKKQTGDADQDSSNADILNRLVKAQRAWVAYRDANSILHGIEMLGGSGEGPVVNGSLYGMTKDRVLELNDIIGSSN